MANTFHEVQLFVGNKLVKQTLWSGPLEGVIAIAKTDMQKKRADWARIVVESEAAEVWSSEQAVKRDHESG